jgi:hypothetical protein
MTAGSYRHEHSDSAFLLPVPLKREDRHPQSLGRI